MKNKVAMKRSPVSQQTTRGGRNIASLLWKAFTIGSIVASAALARTDFDVIRRDFDVGKLDVGVKTQRVTSSKAESRYEGKGRDTTEWYYTTDGTNGLELPLDISQMRSQDDVTLFLWFRSKLSKQELKANTETNSVVVEIPGTASCFIEAGTADFVCDVGSTLFTIPADEVIDYRQWTHLTLALDVGSHSNASYLRLDYLGHSATSEEAKTSVLSRLHKGESLEYHRAFLGIDEELENGFVGDLREFVLLQNFAR